MALLLNIDTATEFASVCLSNNDVILSQKQNATQKEHASFIHEAIKEIMQNSSTDLTSLDAIAATAGPGSYTGLRVGLATAKGLCYALNKPLITINTLEVMTKAATSQYPDIVHENLLFCPMIDARRMEVFTAIYGSSFETVLQPCAMILDATSFQQWLSERKIVFFGSGSVKFGNIIQHTNALFPQVQHSAADLAFLAEIAFNKKQFANLAYAEPLYIKEFHSQH